MVAVSRLPPRLDSPAGFVVRPLGAFVCPCSEKETWMNINNSTVQDVVDIV